MSERACLHPACRCPRSADSDYCSAVCAEAANGGITADGCECGHGDCASPYDRAPVGAAPSEEEP